MVGFSALLMFLWTFFGVSIRSETIFLIKCISEIFLKFVILLDYHLQSAKYLAEMIISHVVFA